MKLHLYCSKEIVEDNYTYKFRLKIVKKERGEILIPSHDLQARICLVFMSMMLYILYFFS